MSRARYDSLFSLLQKVCRQHGIAFYPHLIRFSSIWKKAVGPTISQNTEVRHFQRGIAWIYTPSPTWRFELTQMKSQLIDHLNRAYGHQVVKDLRFEIGTLSARGAGPLETSGEEERPRVTHLSEDEAAWIKRCVSEIPDPKLRQSSERILARFLLKSLKTNRKG